MFAIALRTLRTRWIGSLGALIGTALAVALVTCWGILLQSSATAPVEPHRYAAAPVIIAGNQSLTVHYGHGDSRDSSTELMPEPVRLDAGLAGKIAGRPGVARTVPEVSFAGTLAGTSTTVRNWSSSALGGVRITRGARPGHGQVAVDTATAKRTGLGLGAHTTLLTATGPVPVTVSGITSGGTFVADAAAAQLAGLGGKVDAIGVFPRSGVSTAQLADAVRPAAGAAKVFTGDDRGRAERPDLVQAKADLSSMAGAIGGIAIMVAVFVVAATLAVSIQQRSREIALLRAVAATPRQIRRMVAGEGLILAAAAALIGCGPGALLAAFMRSVMVHRGILPAGLALQVGWIPFVVAGGAGLVVVQLAGIAAGRRAARIRPTAALAESSVQPGRLGIVRLVLGTGALAGGIAILSASLSMTGDDAAGAAAGVVMILMVAVGLLGPVIAWLGSVLLGAPLRWISRIGGFLAAVHARARSRRLASAVTPVALTVSLAFITVFLQATISHAGDRQSQQRLIADRVLSADGAGIPLDAVDRMAAVSGVDSAVGIRPTQIEQGNDLSDFDAQVVTGGRLDRVLDLSVLHGSVDSLGADRIAISTDRASATHASVGDRMQIRLGDGTVVSPRVAGIYDSSLGFADVLLPWGLAAGHVQTPAPSTVLIRLARSADPKAVDAALHQAYPAAHSGDRAAYHRQEAADQAANAWVNYLLLGVVVGYAAVAVANTLVMTTTERRREFALLRLIGATTGQVLRMMRWEAALVSLLGVGIGTAVGFATLYPFSRALGHGTAPYVPPLSFAMIAGGATALALLATLLPARRALAHRPIEAAGIRE
jgi:putative ABC transport system permease protein